MAGISGIRIEAAKIASTRFYKVLNGTYDEVYNNLPSNYFDLVICNDVVEHMVDHDKFFELIKSKMQNKAYMVGSIPNVRYCTNLYGLLVKKDWKYENDGILDKTHLKFFTEKSLKKTLYTHGFRVEFFKGINSSFAKTVSPKKNLLNILLLFAIVATFGYYRDIQFVQFGFRVVYEYPYFNKI